MAYPLKEWKTTFKYGAKYRSGGIHKGIDGRAAIGTPVYAAVNGVVVHAGWHIDGARAGVVRSEST
jgi:murein DD-endopeptidase MepM/ murein hydrolase activator NlpD